MTGSAAALLARYREALTDPGAATPAAALLDEALARCGCGRGADRHARRSVTTAVFDVHASPADADCAEHLTVARYITLFFPVEDGPPEEAQALADRIRVAGSGSDTVDGTGYGGSEPTRQ